VSGSHGSTAWDALEITTSLHSAAKAAASPPSASKSHALLAWDSDFRGGVRAAGKDRALLVFFLPVKNSPAKFSPRTLRCKPSFISLKSLVR